MELDKDLRSRQEARELVQKAHEAFQVLKTLDQSRLDAIVAAMAEAGNANAERLGRMAAEETGFGNAADKAEKNRFAAQRVSGAVADMKTVGILRRDEEKRVWDVGVPVGVIAGIVPSTNPTSTVIYKSIICLKAGSSVVFSPHPGAVRCTLEAARCMEQAARSAGCPEGAIGCISTPTVQAAQELMSHPLTSLILATGGSAMVRAAYSSGKPAIGVGAGNGPAYIHKSADISKAVADIIRSKTFDNGTVCASEQSVVVEECCAEAVRAEFERQGGYFLCEQEAQKLAGLLLRCDGSMNPKVVGKTALQVAELAGLSVPAGTRVLLAHETQAGPTRPYSREKLCPILAFFVEKNEDTVLERATQVLLAEGAGHTFCIHATQQEVITRFALQIPVSRFLVNTPASLGGIGMSTRLFPALTLGCGAVGGSSSSNNIGPLDLINIRRVAWGTEPLPAQASAPKQHTEQPSPEGADSALIESLTQEILRRLEQQ